VTLPNVGDRIMAQSKTRALRMARINSIHGRYDMAGKSFGRLTVAAAKSQISNGPNRVRMTYGVDENGKTLLLGFTNTFPNPKGDGVIAYSNRKSYYRQGVKSVAPSGITRSIKTK
jgi:hypothetical protein